MSSPIKEDADLKKILDQTTWSFSRVSSYEECPRQFYLQYIEKVKQTDNAFAQWGTLCHHIFERYFKGECALYDLTDIYREEYGRVVTAAFPPNRYTNLSASYYERGIELFDGYPGLPSNLQVLASEEKFITSICGYRFIGFIDLVLLDNSDGGIIIQDFKSKSKFTTAAEQAHYAIQLYLYAKHIIEKYNQQPKLLRFDMFRAGQVVDIPFEQRGFEDATLWLITLITHIYNDKKFEDKVVLQYRKSGKRLSEYRNPDFFCSHLCGCREHCKRSMKMASGQKGVIKNNH